ncbi:MAG: FecR domain-containing protein [Candidatus Symbiothrix sp.]|jgi:ferric-dicitrate binding protein FerR (iron transport regulator)|nr:FecR domain-containing protein [Candidatus Symbiothrix sp.]
MKTKYEEEVRWLSDRMDEDFEQLSEDQYIPGDKIPSEKIYAEINRRIRWRQVYSWSSKIAAVIIPLIVLVGFYTYVDNRVPFFNSGEMVEIQVPQGECMQFMFQDGSRVYLEPASKLRYPKNFALGERKVFLDGAGYFMVEKNAKRPFVVEVSGGQVQVTGTSFDLEAWVNKKEIRLGLDDGKVNFQSEVRKEYALIPGDRMIYDKTTHLCTMTHQSELRSLSAWKNNLITFNDTPLKEALEKLERWYDVSFEIGSDGTNIYSLTMNVNGSLDEALNEISKVTPIIFTMKNDRHIKVELRK